MTKLLLVDDEINVLHALRRVLSRALAARSVDVEIFNDPEAALQRASEVDIDVVVSDYRMPLMDGVTFLRCFRGIQPDATRLLLSAATDFDALVTAVNEVGIFRYLSKPWVDTDFVAAIEAAIRQRERLREEKRLAGEACQVARQDCLPPEEEARRKLAAESPILAQVNWGPDGAIILDDSDSE